MEEDPQIEKLKAWGLQLAGLEQSPWQPACVAAAFGSEVASGDLVFTMHRWIALDAARSPLLEFRLPAEEEGDDVIECVLQAAEIFDLPRQEVTPAEAVELQEAMLQVICEAFAMGLQMKPEGPSDTMPEDGFGCWLPILTRLMTDLHMTRLEALSTPVGQAFALIAAWRHNQGWHASGVKGNYRQRELPEEVEEVAGA